MIICPYCDIPAQLVKGNVIYPNNTYLHNRSYWQCPICKAYVGCHKKTIQPLGRLANSELRKWKVKAHQSFDPLWKSGPEKYFKSRTKAYKWLSNELNLRPSKCHIGMMGISMCKKVVLVCKKIRREIKIDKMRNKNGGIK